MHARWVAAGNDAPAETGIIAPDNALTTAAANPAGIEAGCARMADNRSRVGGNLRRESETPFKERSTLSSIRSPSWA